MNTQHGFQRIGFSAATGLGVERLDQAQQTRPGHDLIHLGEEAFAACLLALAGVFEIGKAHLAHRRLGSGGQAYFSTFENLFGDSLGDIPKLVSVAESSITGASTGAAVGLGLLDITSTSITATNADGFGLQVSNGQVTASDSRITGGANGVWVVPNNDLSQNGRLEFNNNTIVEGQSGAAILVEDFGLANTPIDVFVNSGSSLVGGNGVLLQVNGASTANMTVNNSQLEGDVVAEPTATAHLTLENSATLTGNLTHVSNLSLNSQGQWIMVGDNIGQVSNLSMSGGSVQFGKNDDFFKLSVASLQGNGTFIMDADFAQGKTDFLEVTGQASGSHSLLVSSSGQDPLVDTKLHVVHIGSGNAQFSLVNGRVDLGTYSYDLVQEGNDWYLGSTGTISPGTRSVLALFNGSSHLRV